jgi:CRP-like cAMP-binding protein
MADIADIKKQFLLSDLTDAELGVITKKMAVEEYPKGKHIFREGEPAACIYLVHRGKVEVSKTTTDGWKQRLAVLGENHFFGELSVVEHKKMHGADAVALHDCKVYKIMADDLRSLEQSDPGIAYKIMRTIARVSSKNLHSMNEKLLKLLISY